MAPAILLTPFLLCLFFFTRCAMMESDVDIAPVRPLFYVRQGIEVWEDSSSVPWSRFEIIGDERFAEGKNAVALEASALLWGKKSGAKGMVVLHRKKRGSNFQVEVGSRQADLNVGEFDLKDYGVEPEETHYGTEVDQEKVMWEIRVRFFKHKALTSP